MRQEHLSGGTCSTGATATGTRSNALWGKKRKRFLLSVLAVVGISIIAGATTSSTSAAGTSAAKAHVPKELKDKAQASPGATFPVIVQTSDPRQLDNVEAAVGKAQKQKPGKAKGVKQKFSSIGTLSADLTGDQIDTLAADPNVAAITEDAETHALAYGNSQDWAATIAAQWAPLPRSATYPTIAIVDSGVQSARADWGGRLVRSVDFTPYNAPNNGGGGDGFGHGTLVAGLAVGGADGFTGAEPHSKIVSLDVLDNTGKGRVSDALAACDWILRNKDNYNIEVANFSINASSGAGIANDPLDKAVEKLWLNGIVVVVAAGNYAVDGAESGVGFAPANDPFVITVGASDTNGTVAPEDDFAAPWSAWGSTQDGFFKPELVAPGRMLNGPAPKDSSMYQSFISRKVADGYIWMSGTSFAAPIVSGAAATVISRHPDWTPDQVKGALIASANAPAGYASVGAMGVGVVNVAGAIAASGQDNPNAGLNQFVTNKTFDATAWAAAAAADPAWNAASWSSASWSSASWSSASWSSASWSSASWSSASWSSMAADK